MTKRLTLRDIAEAAGVSEMTASRALRNAGDVSDRTRKRVKEAADQLGYVRNKIAGSLASSKVDLVGVVIPSVKSYVFSEVLDGISSVLADTNLRPVFGLTNYDLKTEEDVINEMLSWRPSGLIIAGLEHTDTAARMLHATDTPVIEIMDTDGTAIDACVGISHYQAGYDMADTILQKGYRNIGFIGTKMESDFRATKRLNGFRDRLEQDEISLIDQKLYSSGSSIENGKRYTDALIRQNPNMDCIYCSNDVSAVGALMYCIENKLSVPDDLALVGFNNLNLLDGLPVNLATMDSMRFEIGRRAAQIVIDRNATPPLSPPRVQQLSPKIITGNSL
ncbi:LacI family transcriptional regulator [Amylibacter marinus]|uniref:LacI family transcriptional regulator n=1 Tax=Amylibacter marinus TaxID=1475483 RepID=A0ABQ5VUN6_9RHOB|nr:LacI family DNA-binding transcriptional regulator [Amylibacter marinus]GLQ35040.1 LacI family transcriptional regulator [Amylibacter marinus]